MLGLNIKKLAPRAGISHRELVGMIFTPTNLKIAHIKSAADKRVIANLVSKDISGLSDADISKAISSSIYGLRAKSPMLVNIVPSNLVITKNIEIPSTDPREIRDIINLQAGRHTPYSRDEIIVDYIDVATYKNSYTKILLVIVARSNIKKHLELTEKAGFGFSRILLAPEAMAWSASNILKVNTAEAPVAVVHIDESFSDFTVVFKNKVLFIRSIPIGANALLNEKEKQEARFAEELKKSVETYQSENIDANPAMLVLTGATEETKDLERTIGEGARLPVRTIPYFRNMAASEEAMRTLSMTKGASFLGVIAPLMALEEMKVNLVPEEVKLKESLEERGRDLIKIGIFVLTALMLICIISISKIYVKGFILKQLKEKYGTLAGESRKLEDDYSKVSLMRSFMANRGFPIDVLYELYNITPLEIRLEDIKFEAIGKFSVRGTAESMSKVFAFANKMEKTKYFKDVKTKSTSRRKEDTRDVTDFEIAANLDRNKGAD